tara:strand:- start:5241 stop:5672 length:432 start_codon:yes stop_codon:yes gene_type:complete
MKLLVERVGEHQLPLPNQATPGSAGYDLRSNADESVLLTPGMSATIPCGFKIAVPYEYVGKIEPRSGWAVKMAFDTLAGVIDSDYRGEVHIVVINHGDEPVHIGYGNRIAQMLVMPVLHIPVVECDLDETERGDGKFGSTGVE